MPFIPPMLATRLEDLRRLADPRYSAEPKLDGQRAQIHVREHRMVYAFSRPGRELIRLPGLAWLREIRWPVAAAVLAARGWPATAARASRRCSRRGTALVAPWPSRHSTCSRWTAWASWASRGRPGGSGSKISPTGARPCCSHSATLTRADVEIRQAVRVPRDLPFDVRIGERHEMVCWGVMPSGMLRHPVLVSTDQP